MCNLSLTYFKNTIHWVGIEVVTENGWAVPKDLAVGQWAVGSGHRHGTSEVSHWTNSSPCGHSCKTTRTGKNYLGEPPWHGIEIEVKMEIKIELEILALTNSIVRSRGPSFVGITKLG